MEINQPVMRLMVAPSVKVRRDMRRNLSWILGLCLCVFVYVVIMSLTIQQFEDKWTFSHAAYFTIINITTVGFGDIYPITHGGKIIAGLNALAGPIFFGLLVAIIAMAFQPSDWSAELTESDPSEVPESRAHRELTSEEKIADFFESLTTLVRTREEANSTKFQVGHIRIRIESDAPSPTRVHLFIDIRAS